MTIPLLTPESVKKDSTSQQREQQARVRDFSVEEERLVKSINQLRQDEIDEKARIDADVAQFRADAKVEVGKLDKQISNKRQEVEALEARRVEAMKPIEVVRKEADDRNAKSKDREDAIAIREATQKLADEAHTEALEKLHDREQLIAEREDELDDREERVRQEEDRSKESLAGVNQRWADFHIAVAAKDKEFIDRETTVSAGEQANIIRSQELDKKEFDYKEKDREIASRYEALERASLQILGTQHD